MADIRDTYTLEVKTDKAKKGIGGATTSIATLGAGLARMGPLAAAAGAALAGIGAVSYISNTITEFDDLAKAARNVGAATDEEFEGFQTASKLLGEMGLTASETDRAFRNMTTRLQKAAETGKGPAADAFAKLGDSILKSNGEVKDFPQLFEAVSQALADGTLTVVEAQGALGEMVGPKILGGMQALADSGMSVADAMADVKENSNIVSLEAAEQAEVFGDTMGRLGEVAGRLGTDIATALLPILVELAEGALVVLPGIIDGVKFAFDALQPALDVLGAILENVIIPVLKLWFDIFKQLFDILHPIAEVISGALVTGIEAVGSAIQTTVEFIETFIERLGAIGDKVSEITGAVGDKWNNMTDGIQQGAKDAYDGVTGWFGQMYDEVVGNSIIPDMADEILGVFDALQRGMVDKTGDGVDGVTREFDVAADAIATGFNGYAQGALNGIESLVDSITGGLYTKIRSLTRDISGSIGGIFDIFGGGSGSGGGNFFENLIDDFFGGFFANGGTLPRGQFGIVGERGPELVTGPAQITPLDGLGGAQYVTYNINATDARSFRDLLARDPSYIHALAQQGGRREPRRAR